MQCDPFALNGQVGCANVELVFVQRNAVALATDSALFPVAMFLASRLASLDPPSGTEIVVFSDSQRDIDVAREWGAPCQLQYIHVPNLPRLSHEETIQGKPGAFSVATFYRLFIPQLLRDFDRILYLDTDVYPESTVLWRLFALALDDSTFAAVRAYTAVYSPGGPKELQDTLCHDEKYLNAGVLLIDRARYVEAELGQRIFEVAAQNSMNDQSAMNRFLQGQWVELSPAFNASLLAYKTLIGALFPPQITHFIGPLKPWVGAPLAFPIAHPMRAEMERFFPTTPWRTFLTRYFDFAQAWNRSTIAPQQIHVPEGFREKAARYVAKTEFADVRQGITPAPNFKNGVMAAI